MMNRLKTRKPGGTGTLPPAGPPPRPGGAVPRERRRSAWRPTPLLRCLECGTVAVWFYMPAGDPAQYCDDCVPRGCDCTILPEDMDLPYRLRIETTPDGKEIRHRIYTAREPRKETDGLGREVPCCEYLYRGRGCL